MGRATLSLKLTCPKDTSSKRTTERLLGEVSIKFQFMKENLSLLLFLFLIRIDILLCRPHQRSVSRRYYARSRAQ